LKFSLEDDGSTRTLLVVSAVFIVLNVIYFTIYVPFSSIERSPLFWSFYSLWALLPILYMSRKVRKVGKRTRSVANSQDAAIVFAALLISSLAFAGLHLIPVEAMASGFPGYCAGNAVFCSAVVFKRVLRKTSNTHEG
jgi:hypothetical protein